jgi:hypothetical protein
MPRSALVCYLFGISRFFQVRILPPGKGPKRGRGGSLSSRQAILHSLVHIESWAVDLSWDIIARFGPAYSMPREFFDDFVKVAADEGRHFQALERRLRDMGSSYGAVSWSLRIVSRRIYVLCRADSWWPRYGQRVKPSKMPACLSMCSGFVLCCGWRLILAFGASTSQNWRPCVESLDDLFGIGVVARLGTSVVSPEQKWKVGTFI